MGIYKKVQNDTHISIRKQRIKEHISQIEGLLSKPRLPAGERKRLKAKVAELKAELKALSAEKPGYFPGEVR